MQYIEQSDKDLRLYLMSADAPRNSFKVISKTFVNESLFKVEFGVLAESHYATVIYNDEYFTEICACVDLHLPNESASLLTDIGDSTIKTEAGSLIHTFNFRTENMSNQEVKLAALQSKRPHPHSYYLEHIFPTQGPGAVSPITEVYVTMGAKLLIETVHTYPNQDAMVFTTSQIEVK